MFCGMVAANDNAFFLVKQTFCRNLGLEHTRLGLFRPICFFKTFLIEFDVIT